MINNKVVYSKRKFLLQLVIVCFMVVFFSAYAMGATYYVDATMASDSGSGVSWSSAKKYIKSGISLMDSGDTLIIKDGVYTGDNNCLYFYGGIPNGTGNNYTTIKAENDFGVIIDGEGIRSPWYMGTDSSPASYIQIEGILFRNSNKSCFMVVSKNSNHVKVTKCAAYDAGDGDAFCFASQGDYNLFEDCFAWGRGRYKFCCGTRYTILRRCVARYDYHSPDVVGDTGWPDPYACFAFYHHENCVMQNCIAIDSLDVNSVRPDDETRAFQSANGSDKVTIDSCVALNVDGKGIMWESTNPDSFIKNSVVWDTGREAIQVTNLLADHPIHVDHNILGVKKDPYGMEVGVNTWDPKKVNALSVTNNIICGIQDSNRGYGILNADNVDYNSLYNNRFDYNGVSAGTHDKSLSNGNVVDPIDGSPGNGVTALKYLLRIENGSDLDGAGSSGTDIGATIIKRLGKTGTVYGETGWDKQQNGMEGQEDIELWPFPNEDKIKELMSTYSRHGVNGARGFCSGNSLDGTPQTLTKYIWEYLGNEIPSYIYGGGTTGNQLPTAAASASPTSGEASLTVNFTGSGNDSDGTIVSYLWSFGDGETSTDQNPTHIYDNAGNFTATLVVTDNDGSEAAASLDITVTGVTEVNYYIDSSIGSDGNPGTITQPWKSIQYAVDHVESGTIGLKDTGVPYSPFLLINKSDIMIQGINGKPEIRGTQYHDGRYVGVFMENARNIILDNLDINGNETSGKDGGYDGLRMILGTSNITIKNCEIHHNGKRNIMLGSNVNYITLENNFIHHALNGHGVYFSNGGHDYVVRGNVFADNHSTGMQINGDGAYMYNILFEKNTFSRNAEGLNHTGSDDPAETLSLAQVHDAVVKNNIFYDNFRKGVTVYSDSSPSYNVEIYNNTFYVHNDTGRPAIQVITNSSHDVFVKNNIVVNQQVENVSDSENLITSGNEASIFISGVPDCEGDLKLKSGSIAVDQGVDLSGEGVFTDFDGNSRPQGSGYDLGAYEYLGASDTVPPVIGNVGSNNITTTTATIVWSTDEQANGHVDYGETSGYGLQTTQTTLGISQQVTLSGLQSATTYHYKITCTDRSNNSAESNDFTFTTQEGGSGVDTTPPAPPSGLGVH